MALFCIEDAEIMENHRDSSIAKWLEAQGFRDERPDDTWHRVGPWIFPSTNSMTYRYCPHYACGSSRVFEGVHFTFDEFKVIWSSLASARERMRILPSWGDRIKAKGR